MRILRTVLAVVLGASGVILVGGGPLPAAADAPTPTEWALPAFSDAGGIVRGPDDRMWFTTKSGLTAITETGQQTTYPLPTTDRAWGVVAGAGGAVWTAADDHIYRVTTSGTITTFTPPTPGSISGLASAPDGNLWYTSLSSTVGRLTPAGAFTEFTVPAHQLESGPSGLTVGPDGALWYLQRIRGTVGRVSMSGEITEIPLPSVGGELSTLATGPDGNLWIGYDYVGVIGRLTPGGAFTSFPGPQRTKFASSGGTLWFAGARQYGTISSSGTITTLGSTGMIEIAAGPGGTVWYTSSRVALYRDAVGRIDPAPSPRGELTPLTPARILDTRSGLGAPARPVGAAAGIDVQVTGRGGVPADGVAAVILNVTVTEPTAWGYVSVYPTGGTRPTVSNVNFTPGQTLANMVTVAVGDGGRVRAYNAVGGTHVLFDVVGYYADADGPFGSRFVSVVPQRAFDTRSGHGGVPAQPLGAGGVVRFDITGAAGVPASGVTAVVLNLTATAPTAATYLTAYPDDHARPLASSLNLPAGATVPNLVTVRVPDTGIVDVYNAAGATHVVADVMGYYTTGVGTNAGRFVPITPRRTYDSRVSDLSGIVFGKLWGPRLVPLYRWDEPWPIGGLDAAVVNVTVTEPEAAGWLQVLPPGLCDRPQSSNVNYAAGQTVANSVVADVGSVGFCTGPGEGQIDAFSTALTHVVVDMFGYFTTDDYAVPGG